MSTGNLGTVADVARLIDHTLLAANATEAEIVRVAEEALQWGTASVCVNPLWIQTAAKIGGGSDVACCSVVGFPLGASVPEIVADEAVRAVKDGAGEIDMVIPVGKAVAADWDGVRHAVETVKEAIGGTCLKVILEICELSLEQVGQASRHALDGGADYIKTSTGFGKHGTTLEAVTIMAEVAEGRAGIKAAGGIRSYEMLKEMVVAGATRIGASATGTILEEARRQIEG